jgi:hypothetical protein
LTQGEDAGSLLSLLPAPNTVRLAWQQQQQQREEERRQRQQCSGVIIMLTHDALLVEDMVADCGSGCRALMHSHGVRRSHWPGKGQRCFHVVAA